MHSFIDKKIKIGYFADGIWGINALHKFILDKSIKIVFVCVRYNHPDKELIKAIKKYGGG